MRFLMSAAVTAAPYITTRVTLPHRHLYHRDSRPSNRRGRLDEGPLPFDDDVRTPMSQEESSSRMGRQRWQRSTALWPKYRKVKLPIPFDVTQENKFQLINHTMCPLLDVEYEDQLKIKYSGMKQLLRQLGQKLNTCAKSGLVVDGQGMPCPLHFTKRSPRWLEYRNKDEFSLWTGVDGNSKTVGFFIGTPAVHSDVVCVEPENLIITKKSHRKLAAHFQHYLRTISPLDVCLNFSEGGNWRRFVVRSNEVGEHMIIAHLHPQDLTDVMLTGEKKRLTDYFSSIANDLNIKSAYLQSMRTSLTPADSDPYHHLFGDKVLTEVLLGKKFVISPDSFFQTNTLAAEVLYNTVLDELDLKKDMTVIDLCSGTGTMSVLMAPHVRRVIGIEVNFQAVADAERNAQRNGATNISFIRGSVENVMPSLSEELFGQRVVIVANPGRAGLRSAVISTIRQMKSARKLVYISCKPAGDALKNFFHLISGTDGDNGGSALLSTNAIPIDMFPQTDHVELVMTFERFA